MISKNKWKEMIEASKGVSNVSIVCSDGKIHSHKIIIARISDFIKEMMISIPAADDVTIFLPDSKTSQIQSVINQLIFGETCQPSLIEDLQYVIKFSPLPTSFLQDNKEMPLEIFMKAEEVSDTIKQEMEDADGDSYEESFITDNFVDMNSDNLECQNGVLSTKKGKKPLSKQFFSKSEVSDSSSSVSSRENDQYFKQLAHLFLQNNQDPDADEDYKSKNGDKGQKIKEKRQLFRNAIEDIARGESSTISSAARKYGLNRGTLKEVLKSGKNYQGSGTVSKVFTQDEEKMITARILQNLNDGEALTRKMVGDFLSQEFEIISRDHPERGLPADIKSFTRSFLTRNELNGYMESKSRSPVKNKLTSDRQSIPIQEQAKNFLLNGDEDFNFEDKSVVGDKKKAVLERREKYRIAAEAIAKGECLTAGTAATKYGVNRGTLKRLLESGQNFQGSGKSLSLFNREEEIILKERILTRSDGGKNLTKEIVSDVLNEELSIMKINQPDRNFPESVGRFFIYNFVERHHLKKTFHDNVEATLKDRRNFECEICYSKFTFKNSLVTHQKKCHIAFYNC